MRRGLRDLASDTRGSPAVEFAIVSPVLIVLLVGIFQLGMIFLARAGLGQAVETGARYATIYPRPSDSQIRSKILASGYGMRTAGITGPTFAHGTANGSPYVDITMRYTMALDFGLYRPSPLAFSYTRRAYQVG